MFMSKASVITAQCQLWEPVSIATRQTIYVVMGWAAPRVLRRRVSTSVLDMAMVNT
jgi:hypothetical protein